MFFLLRSAFCITAVMLSLPGQSGLQGVAGGRSAVVAARDFCQAAPQSCLLFVKGEIAGVSQQTGAAHAPARALRPSLDTLLPEDRRPAWRGRSELTRS